MRFSLVSIVLLAWSSSMALAAQPSAKKKGASAPPAKAPAKSDANADDAAPADDKAASDEQDKQPAKPGGKKGPGLKITTADETELLKTLSYMQGYGTGKQIKMQFEEQGVELDDEVLLAAFKDGLIGKEPTMTEEQMNDLLPEIQKLVAAKREAKLKEAAAENKEEGETFLAANKKKEGVKTLPSGLQYKVLKSGKGETPKRSDTVKAHYKGSFLNGTEFESSYKAGAPASFPVGRVIKGWTEALQLMKVGDKWQLFIPSSLAYGEEGGRDPQGRQVIPPNATLIFEVELLGIEKGSKLPPPTFK